MYLRKETQFTYTQVSCSVLYTSLNSIQGCSGAPNFGIQKEYLDQRGVLICENCTGRANIPLCPPSRLGLLASFSIHMHEHCPMEFTDLRAYLRTYVHTYVRTMPKLLLQSDQQEISSMYTCTYVYVCTFVLLPITLFNYVRMYTYRGTSLSIWTFHTNKTSLRMLCISGPKL